MILKISFGAKLCGFNWKPNAFVVLTSHNSQKQTKIAHKNDSETAPASIIPIIRLFDVKSRLKRIRKVMVET